MERTDTSTLDAELRDDRRTVARLYVEEMGRAPRAFVLERGRALRVGRGEDQDIHLDDKRASRRHATLTYDGARVTVADEGSSNGTFVGDVRVGAATALPPGAAVRIGGARILLLAVGAGAAEAEPAAVAVDPASVRLFDQARRVAATDLPAVIQGETGSGKEVVARALHRQSGRAGAPFVIASCAALPESIADVELFGAEREGAGGAVERRPGLVEAGDCGVVLLDEVGELSPANQARLLRLLQDGSVLRVGAPRPTRVDVRVLAASTRDLAADVARGRFREDLFFRLGAATLLVPALRDRPRDIIPLAERALARRGARRAFGPGFTDALLRHRWPGNVRELFNALDCALALAEGDTLLPDHLPPAVRGAAQRAQNPAAPLRSVVDEVERGSIVAALERHGHNQSRAAVALGISRRALIYKMERYGLKALPRRPAAG
ncbi:MAG: sigma 54-interacting transcriptional regulator [Polyangiales bacterium]